MQIATIRGRIPTSWVAVVDPNFQTRDTRVNDLRATEDGTIRATEQGDLRIVEQA